jgi:hypothetical protein
MDSELGIMLDSGLSRMRKQGNRKHGERAGTFPLTITLDHLYGHIQEDLSHGIQQLYC